MKYGINYDLLLLKNNNTYHSLASASSACFACVIISRRTSALFVFVNNRAIVTVYNKSVYEMSSGFLFPSIFLSSLCQLLMHVVHLCSFKHFIAVWEIPHQHCGMVADWLERLACGWRL